MLQTYAQEPSVPVLQESRVTADCAFSMTEGAQDSGEFSTPAVGDLMLSQSVGSAFRYVCDIGAGRFSGRTEPMDFVAVAPNVDTYCNVASPARLRFLGIPGEFARACLERDASDPLDFGAVHTRHHHDPLIIQGLTLVWQEMGREDPAARIFLDGMMAVLVVRLSRLSQQVARVEDCRGGLAPRQSARVIEYMHRHLDQPVTLAELAALCSLSPWHFSRAFAHSHGDPPHRYLTRLRLRKARELLETTSLPIHEVASATGYSHQQLVRHFRRATGLPPGVYRQQYRDRR
ncbi:MAG: AraC family transcriptional regulator [Halorhodospira halophila]|uniref:helix-turn-helix domain-containing protein n=1 Tax=Halorhodospira halophila TaxID=1053 RepID=UPI0026F29362|nr:AraC family transcriptional regulator [Halorhodospira halophila]MCC3750449.1 AraC family transcriptional regulator [Halorhodospira halophila]